MILKYLYHEGELEVQKRTGEQVIAERNGRVIIGGMMPKAISFIQEQHMVVVGSIDYKNRPWASLIFGTPGFLTADETQIKINRSNMVNNDVDIFWQNIINQNDVGLLVIELSSRRRMRANGKIAHVDSSQVCVDVETSYPNCPKYIQRRHTQSSDSWKNKIAKRVGQDKKLIMNQIELINKADTMFVASQHPTAGVDVSHRGGNPGFMKVLNDQTIRIPDYFGNSMYNTLGNFVSNPVAGIIIPNFDTGSILQLTGSVQIHWDMNDEVLETDRTSRYWDFTVIELMEYQNAVPTDWELLDTSQFNP